MTRALVIFSAVAALALFGGGFGLGRSCAPDAPAPVLEQPEPAEVLDGGALVLQRAEETTPEASPVPVPRELPPGAERVVRMETLTLRGRRPALLAADAGAAAPVDAGPCPDVHVQLADVAMEDGSSRVVASSTDGQVLGGLDVPLAAESSPPGGPLANALGLAYRLPRPAVGVWYERELGDRFRAGAELLYRMGQGSEPDGLEVAARLGVRF